MLMGLLAWAWNAESADAPSATRAEWVARSWQTGDGLPQNSVNAITQTRDGFLWVGTTGGLARFDGMSFRRFGLQDGLRSVYVMALAEDRQGALWIGTSGGGLSRWENGRITSFGAAEGFPAGTDVVSLAADEDGTIWIGTDKGLVHGSVGTLKSIGEAQGLPRKQIRALAQDSQGTLWVSVILEGLFRGTNGKFTRVEKGEGTPGDVYSLLADRDGSIWAGVGGGALWRWRDGAWKRFSTEDGLPKQNIEALSQGGDGVLWVGARNGGLHHSNGERFEQATVDARLSGLSVRAVEVDREGSVWVGTTAAGLFRLSPRVLEFRGADAGLPSGTVSSVAEDASGTLWAGTTGKGIHRFDGARFTKLEDTAVSGNYPFIYCTAATSDGIIWAAGEQCLYRFQPGQPTKAFLDAPVRGEAIRALCADGETLWIGTYYSALLKGDADGVKVIAPDRSFPGGITGIVREAADTLWVSTSEGLHRWERGEVKTWNTRDGLLTANICTMHRDADGTLWLGTLGGGLARFKDGRIVNITTRHGLIDDVISQIVADDTGCLWLGCNRGIMRVERRELDAIADGTASDLHPIVFGKNEGMLQEQCSGGHSPTAIKTRDGRLLFPTVGGIAEIDPRRLQNLARNVSQVSIDRILVDGVTHAVDAEIDVPPGKHRVEVDYTVPVLRGGEWVRFRHRLDGLDHDWTMVGGSRLATYDGLPPGDYVFRVAASDGGGNWNELGARLAITVQPFFWQTGWFRTLGILLLVSAGSGAAWLQAHFRHRRKIAELERARKQQLELAHMSRVTLLGELSASLAHELKQPLTAILSNAQAALRFLNDESADLNEVREILKDIAASDRRASEIIGRMRAMMTKGGAEVEPRDLHADIHQVLLLLRSDLVERNVEVTTRLADDLPLVSGDHIQLQQVLLNLIINGCDAMHDNAPDERQLAVETQHDGPDFVRVSLIDRGNGIAPDMLEKIFEPFYTTKSHGLGMGLSICRAIIEAHGGRLWATNNTSRGTAFHFTLRTAKASAAMKEP